MARVPPRRPRRGQPGRQSFGIGMSDPFVLGETAPASTGDAPAPVAAVPLPTADLIAFPSIARPAVPGFAAIAAIDATERLGRMLPHLDEAYAALLGPRVWAAYLQRSGSGAVAAAAGSGPWRFDFAPQVGRRRFDTASGRLVTATGGLRCADPSRILAAASGPWLPGTFEALGGVATGLALDPEGAFAVPAAEWRFHDGRLVCDGEAASGAFAGLVDLGVSSRPVAGLADVALADPGADAYAGFVEARMQAARAVSSFDAARRSLGYHLDDPYGARLASFAGGQLASFLYLCLARLPGFAMALTRVQIAEGGLAEAAPDPARGGADALPGSSLPRASPAVGAGGLLPGLVLPGLVPPDAGIGAFARPVLGAAAVGFAFEALAGIAPYALEGYGPCDLACGLEHLRHLAYSFVAVQARRAGIPVSDVADGDAGDSDARGVALRAREMAFWIDGVDVDASPPRSHGLVPLAVGYRPDATMIADLEPEDLIVTLRARRREAGLDEGVSEASVAARLTLEAGLRRLPAFVQPAGHDERVRAFELKVARARRILREREAAGHVVPERGPAPEGMPELGSDLDETVLRLVPAARCKPRVGPHPDPRGPYQLDEPEFRTRARLRREREAAKAREDAALLPDEA